MFTLLVTCCLELGHVSLWRLLARQGMTKPSCGVSLIGTAAPLWPTCNIQFACGGRGCICPSLWARGVEVSCWQLKKREVCCFHCVCSKPHHGSGWIFASLVQIRNRFRCVVCLFWLILRSVNFIDKDWRKLNKKSDMMTKTMAKYNWHFSQRIKTRRKC